MRKILTKVVPVSAVALMAVGFAGTAHAVDFKVSGQVDRAFVYANNGKRSDAGSVDNNGSNSRFRFTGSQAMGDGLKLGFTYEIGLTQMPSSSWDIGQNSNGSVQLDTRIVDAHLQTNFGTFSLGKGDGAAHYADTRDLSGTNFIGGGVEYEDYNGGITFVDGAGHKLYTIGETNSDFNSLGRVSRIRYDSPSLNGFVASGSFDNGHAYELALRYDLHLPKSVKVKAGLSWTDSENQGIAIDPATGAGYIPTSRVRILNGSASLLLADGLVFSVSAAHAKTADVTGKDTVVTATGLPGQKGYDATNYFGQIGYVFGQNHVVASYGETQDYPYAGFKARQIGAAYVFDWTNAVELYASFHHYQLALPAYVKNATSGFTSAKNINVVFSGLRIKFM